MSNLSPPSIDEPLYECTGLVGIRCFVPGAMIDIYAKQPGSNTPDRIGGGTSFSSSGQVFGVDSSMITVNTKLYATQTFDGTVSANSTEIFPQHALNIDAPLLNAPLLGCAHCIGVDGIIPGTVAAILDGSSVLGKEDTSGGREKINLSPSLTTGHIITATQFYCGGPSSALSASLKVSTAGEFLPPPIVRQPLYECQDVCYVDGCIPGAEVELFVNTNKIDDTCTADISATLSVMNGLVKDTSVTARQSLCDGSLQSNVSSSDVFVRPASDIPRPIILTPLYEGDPNIHVAMTEVGEIVTVQDNDTQIGLASTPGGTVPINVDPVLVVGRKVKATVELCGIKKTSIPVLVGSLPTNILPPKVDQPLYSCSSIVHVKGCLPGSKVRVYATAGSNTVFLGASKTFGNTVGVSVAPLLHAGWQITATQELGMVPSDNSDPPVIVQPHLKPITPTLQSVINACSRCVRISNVTPGARINVYEKGIWMGAATAQSHDVKVDVYPAFTNGRTVSARQSICGKASRAATKRVTRAPDQIGKPVISQPIAGDYSVEVKNLVPGATIEIEEVSIYNLVIGRGCTTEKVTKVSLAFPLFGGARLRARQKLCSTSIYSETIRVPYPPEWPLGEGQFKAGFTIANNIEIIEEEVRFLNGTDINSGVVFKRPDTMKNIAIIYYPSTADGENVPIATSGPFPCIVYGHAKRPPAPVTNLCPGTPQAMIDTTKDFKQLSGIFDHLARWGFLVISPDLSWLTTDAGTSNRAALLREALSYMIGENTRDGSIFKGMIDASRIGAMGHSSGGGATVHLVTAPIHDDTSMSDISKSIKVIGLVAPAAPNISHLMIENFEPSPVLIIHGTHDTGDWGVKNEPIDLYNETKPVAHLVTIDGANHYGYTDSICMKPTLDGSTSISQDDQQRIAKAYLTAFFMRYLKGETKMEGYLTATRLVEDLETFNIAVESKI